MEENFSNNVTTTATTLPPDMLFNEGHRVQIVGYSILMTISAMENIFVLTLLCLRRPMSRMNKLLISLTVSDLLVTFLTMPLEIAWSYTVKWLADDSVCKLMMVGRIFGLYSSSFNLVAISIDRFCIIMYPFTNMTSADKRVRWSLILVWTLSALCSVPQALVFRKIYHPLYPTYGQCATFNSFPSEQLEMTYNVFVTLMIFLIPLVLFCIFYGRLWFFIRKRHIATTVCTTNPDAAASNSNRQPSSASDVIPPPPYDAVAGTTALLRPNGVPAQSKRAAWRESKHKSQSQSMCTDYNLGQSMRYSKAPNIYMRAKSKSFKMAVTLVIVFLVCWVPYYLVSCWFWFDKESLKYIDPRIQRMLFIFAVSQSCLNPIVTGVFCLRLDKKLVGLRCWRNTLGRWLRRGPPPPLLVLQPHANTPGQPMHHANHANNKGSAGNHGHVLVPSEHGHFAAGPALAANNNRSVRAATAHQRRQDQFV
ncbi:putative Gonadotropin-releasing hormone II receptor [Hypsibius exemplaris]|uniref:Gonadotropin-releasing hormone II receptor n=1 Tax=Hypsibius exemplaris TaxID=2072580 RepID=A0A1W0XDX5_HYPEX|nr:putative Gonadotropin-releasing hormone II receptor [Hypsibius exemplaris]